MHQKLKEVNYWFASHRFLYHEILLQTTFIETPAIPTAGVTVTKKGLVMYYNSEFFDNLDFEMSVFVTKHEIFHFLHDHNYRGKHFDKVKANIIMDMIINSLIFKHYKRFNFDNINRQFKEIGNKAYEKMLEKEENESVKEKINKVWEKSKEKTEIWLVPSEYKGRWVFEELYEWFNEENRDQMSKKSQDILDLISSIKENGLGDQLNNGGSTLDQHYENEVSDSLKKTIIKDIINGVKVRGLLGGEEESIIKELSQSKEDYTKKIMRTVGSFVGRTKKSTWSRANRKGLPLKGHKKVNSVFNVILDASFSMHGEFETVFSYIFRNNIIFYLIQNDTKVQKIELIKNKLQLQKVRIKGLGGTVIQPAIDLISSSKYNNYGTILLTDGYTDNLEISKLKNKLLVVTVGTEVPIIGNKHVEQIVVKRES